MVIDGDLNLEKYKQYSNPQELIDDLTKIRGIGAWTVELTMLRSMQRFDAVPADDLGLKRFVSTHYFNGKKITSAQIRTIAENWGPWKGLAAYYFLEADRLNINININ